MIHYVGIKIQSVKSKIGLGKLHIDAINVQYNKIKYFLTANRTLDKKGLKEITCIQRVKKIMQHQH